MDQNEKAVSENEAAELNLESLENTSGGASSKDLLWWICPLCDFFCFADDYETIAAHKPKHERHE